MSCENPPGSVEAVMPRRRKFDKTGICIKCKISSGRLVIRHAVYCKACFLALVTSKFRHVLDPTINAASGEPLVRGSLKASGNLMIGFSGGLGSTVLLDLVKACYLSFEKGETHKGGKKHPRKTGRVWDRVVVCYVECCEGYESTDRTPDVKVAVEKYEGLFEFLPLRLQDAFQTHSPHQTHVAIDLSCEDLPISTSPVLDDVSSVFLLRSYLSSLPTATSHQSSISSLTRLLLQHAARTHGCSHLLLGTSLTGLSINLINAVAGGAGYTVGLEKAEDWQSGDATVVRIVRPLREISNKECAAYVRWRSLSVIGNMRMFSERRNIKESIGGLTKEFIFGLERDYPSTVSAIVRTCDKLVSNTEGPKCVLCERPVQAGIQEWKERISIRSMPSMPKDSSELTCDVAKTAELKSNDTEKLAPRLCYACHTTLISRSSRGARRTTGINDAPPSTTLPEWVGRNIGAGMGVTQGTMREQIQEFLLDNEDSACA